MQALAQDFDTQTQVCDVAPWLAEELALDFEGLLFRFSQEGRAQSPDLWALEAHFERKSGQPEYWTLQAMESDPFWDEVRATARQVLQNRGMSTAPPIPVKVTVMPVSEVPVGPPPGLWTRFKALFS